MEIFILFLLTLLNGFFALSEIAIVSVRKTRMEQLAKAGSKNAQAVLSLLKKPEAFLSAVQVGITLVGIIAGAYGAANLADDVQPWLERVPFLAPYAEGLAFALVIALITYFSIVIGELIPKTVAIGHSEKIALWVAPVIKVFTTLALPLVKLLAFSTNLILKVFHFKAAPEEKISEEDLRYMLKTAGKQGLLAKDETEIHQNLFYFSRQKARSMQTHRKDLEWIDVNAPLPEIKELICRSVHSKFPVSDGAADNVIGILTTKDFYEYLLHPERPLRSILKKPVYVSETMLASDILNLFRKHKQNLGVVVDEFGAVEGVITLHDILEALVGDVPDIEQDYEPDIVKRQDGSYLVNGSISIRMLNRELDTELIKKDPAHYATLAGFLLFSKGRVPEIGEHFTHKDYEMEVVDMDGFKIDKVLLRKLPGQEPVTI